MTILPKIDLPTYNVTLPISKLNITFRPYLAKEHKLLLMAIESKEPQTITNALNQIINNCLITDLDVRQLAIADTEFLFYNLRARSENELVNLKFKCTALNSEAVKCGNPVPIELNLIRDLDENSIKNKELSKIVEFGNNTGVVLKYITFLDKELADNLTPDEIFEYFADHIDSIYNENAVYSSSDLPKSHFVQFLENLPIKDFIKVERFFNNQPEIIKNISVTCKKCGNVHNIEIEDIFNFLV